MPSLSAAWAQRPNTIQRHYFMPVDREHWQRSTNKQFKHSLDLGSSLCELPDAIHPCDPGLATNLSTESLFHGTEVVKTRRLTRRVVVLVTCAYNGAYTLPL